jgi:hypothetical protein
MSCRALPSSLQLGGPLADAVLVADRMPARPAALTGSPNPAGCLQLPEEPEDLVAVPAHLLGKR